MQQQYELILCHAANDNELQGTELLYSPLSLAYIARHTPDHYNISMYDEYVGEPIDPDNIEADLIAVSCLTSGVTRAYYIADRLRKRGIYCAIGGAHATALPDEALQHFDTVIKGEGEGPWKNFLQDFEEGKPESTYFGEMNVSLDNLGTPDRRYIHENYHIPSLLTSRGCPYSCSFCYLTVYSNRMYRPIPHETVLSDMDTLRGEPILAITDENFIGYRKQDHEDRKELLRKMIERDYDFNWGCQASLHIAYDDELMELMYKAGCRAVFIGFEASDKDALKSVNKKQNLNVNYKDVIKRMHKHKLAVIASTILGLDNQDKNYHKKLIKELKDNKADFVRVFYMTAWPGTPLYKNLLKEGRISNDWDKLRQDTPSLQFKNYTREEAIEARKAIMDAFFNWKMALRIIMRWFFIDRSLLGMFLKLYLRNSKSEKIRNNRAKKKLENEKQKISGKKTYQNAVAVNK
ncbi:MAG: radical SAM protein [Flavobacteriales bacterium]